MSMWAVCVAGMAGGVLAVDGQPGKSLTFLVVFALMLGLTAAWFACSRREELELLCVPKFEVDLEFSGGPSESGIVDVAVNVSVDGGQRGT